MNYLLSFLFCGFVCVVAQLIYEYTKLTPGHITCSFVVIGALLDLFHIYDRLIKIFHAGAMLPITSFGHFTDAWCYGRQKNMVFLDWLWECLI